MRVNFTALLLAIYFIGLPAVAGNTIPSLDGNLFSYAHNCLARVPDKQKQYATESSYTKHPGIILWVWRYDADMRWIDSTKYGIAYLAGTVKIGKNGVVKLPRLNSLKVPDGTSVEAVVRLEVAPGLKLQLKQTELIRKAIVSMIPFEKVSSLQIDFDATRSQRPFYQNLLKELRDKDVPPAIPLNMTALASWTLFDKWTGDIPVNNVVPMFFRMGKDRKKMVACLKKGMVKDTNCIGLSVDEPDVLDALAGKDLLKSFKRIYIFSPGGWTNSQSKNFAKDLHKQIK